MRWFLCIVLVSLSYGNDEGTLDVASFNIQIFGESKVHNDEVREILLDVVQRYDLVLIQEIRDSKGEAIKFFLEELNKRSDDVEYAVTVSERLGRSSSKEQYAFLYRTDWLSVKEAQVYDDVGDKFEREPYTVLFESKKAALEQFAVIGIHTKPDDAENEISLLAEVHKDVVSRWGVNDVMIMGDFNGDCHYTSNWDKIKLATDRKFYWLIDTSWDTTVKTTECTYDRIVVTGDSLLNSMLPESAGAYRFDKGMDSDLAEKVSDHYPVHFKIYSREAKEYVTSLQSLCASDSRNDVNRDEVEKIAKNLGSEYSVSMLYTETQQLSYFSASKDGVGKEDLFKELEKAQVDMPALPITDVVVKSIESSVSAELGELYAHSTDGVTQPYSDYYNKLKLAYKLIVTCTELESSPECQVCASLRKEVPKLMNKDEL